ncbi:lipid A export permease/ATP-binding protein MsbA [Sediminicurvatus halobius]|uniref:Lipid A export permease/ATP-binding protein MsbA n=1 Tax=Sediminicurvatus halobius TaxID=2182432 RepID=A0A2U2N2G0_9GAMM|nr:lipid A export permease/ATP-binding protein MsbA [Spiribacter halobius]PWG63228.1 lipid A export permease/ATP-binding protein MsbA [Spiribacter halobius]UEX76701.1 lipid A export permease/ATP-binding protein MsbA [Spiribacter halobius]
MRKPAIPLTELAEGSAAQVYRRLLGYVAQYPLVATAAIGGMIITGATEAVFAWLIKPMLDSGFVERDPTILRLIPLAILGVFLVRGVTSFASSYGMAWIGRKVIGRLREQVFERLLTLPRRYFDDSSSSMLLSKLTYNVEQVAQAGTNALIVLVRDTATVFFLLGYMAWLSWRLALVFLLLGPVVTAVVAYVSRRFRRLSHRIQRSVGTVAYVAEEAIEGSDEVRIFGAQTHERRRFAAANERNTRQFLKFAATKALSTPVVQFCAAAALSAVVWLATVQGMVETVTVGTFVSFIAAMLLLLQPLKRLTSVHAQIQRGVAAGESIFELIDEPPEVDTGTHDPGRVTGRIDFEGVQFAYRDPRAPVLHGIDLGVAAGETVAIVGRSGSGKTTLVNLLPRFYDVTAGCLRLDGVPLTEYRLEALRRQIAMVGQQVVLFNDSIAANIAYGQEPAPPRERIEAAAEAANALEFIRDLPQGFDTPVGENGVLLSGGQRQRLAIARALLKDAPVLILDEATSALDSESEQHIQSALERLMQGRTTLVIAHRLSTVENADRIVVLDAGRVVETGDHATLIARNGAYAALHNLQFSAARADAGA